MTGEGQEGAPIRIKYDEDGKSGWYTIGVSIKYEGVYDVDDQKESNYYGLDYDEQYSIGNVITSMILEDWIEPTLEEFETYLAD